MHQTPRWGHSNTFSHFFSPDSSFQEDYAQGIAAFGFFLTTLLLLWFLVILVLKLLAKGSDPNPADSERENDAVTCCGSSSSQRSSPIGCAAGGSVIDVQYIKKHRRDLKPHLQRMVIRSWRVQSVFLLASILLPVAIYFFLTRGLSTFVAGLDAVQVINHDVQQLTDRSFGIIGSLLTERDRIRQLDRDGMLSVDRHCPNLNVHANGTFNSSVPVAFFGVSKDLSSTLDAMDRLVDENVIYARQGLNTMTRTTTSINRAFETVYDNDWVPKLFVMILAIINLFFLAGVVLTRFNVVILPLTCMHVWFLMPIFMLLLIVAILATSTFGMMASVNADFCAGGGTNANTTYMSPKGTVEEIVLSHVSATSDVMYQAFDYYINVRLRSIEGFPQRRTELTCSPLVRLPGLHLQKSF